MSIYLKSTGLFRVLQDAGVEIDDRGVDFRPDPKIIMPLTRFHNEDEVEDLSNSALEVLSNSNFGSSNLNHIVTETFAELAMNAVQHSESSIGGLGLIQFYPFQQGQRFVCAVADGGIGIRRSLERNPSLRNRVPYDWVAIELAVRERISGTGSANRGIGLYGVLEDMRKPQRQLIIHSGIGMLITTEEVESRATRQTLFPATLGYAAIPS